MAIRINRGFKSQEALKAKYRKRYGKLWYTKSSVYSKYKKERDKSLTKSRSKWGKSTKKSTSKKKKSSGLSAFGEAGVTLKRLGYKRKLTSKSLDTLEKRKKKIKALRAKGATAKQWEGVRRPKAKSSSKRTTAKSAFSKKSKAARRDAYRKAHGPNWWKKAAIKAKFKAGKAP